MNSSSPESNYNNMSSNLTDDGQNPICLREDTIFLIFAVWEILDKFLAVATNGVTIFIVYVHRYDMLEIPSNTLITCLTMADLASVAALPFAIASMYLSHPLGWTVSCFLNVYISYTTSMINIVTLCMMAVDRLIYVVYPLQYHIKMPVTRTKSICIGIWIFSSLYSLLPVGLGYTDVYRMGAIVLPCRASFSVTGAPARLLGIPFLIFVPVTIGCYVKVGLVALKQRNAIAAAGSSQEQPVGIDFKITKVMFNVLSVYILCTLVVMVIPAIRSYVQNYSCGVVLRVLAFIWRMNIWMNPVIYAWKSRRFRCYVRGIFNMNQVHGTDPRLI